jgi:hypothetical protein
LLPEHCDPTAGRLDLRSAGLSLAAVLAGVYALKQAAENGVGWSPLLSWPRASQSAPRSSLASDGSTIH